MEYAILQGQRGFMYLESRAAPELLMTALLVLERLTLLLLIRFESRQQCKVYRENALTLHGDCRHSRGPSTPPSLPRRAGSLGLRSG